jgi:hypothetical protein
MKSLKERRRHAELKGVKKALLRLGRRPVTKLSGEANLREEVRGHVMRERRFGHDQALTQAIDKVVDAYVIELQADLDRKHRAEEVELGALEARLDGLIAKYRADLRHDDDAIAHLRHQRRGAMRRVEDWDTPMRAGIGAAEDDAFAHGNAGDMVDRGLRTRLVLYAVLALAIVADLIAFRQVVERVVNDNAVFPLVLALTATTTWVAHRAGEAFSASIRGRLRHFRRSIGGWSLSGIWLLAGLGIFVFRLLAPAAVGGGTVDDWVTGGGATSSGDGSAGLNAVLLLLLYVVTGAVALTAGYQRPRPEIEQFRKVSKTLRRAEPDLAALEHDVAVAETLRRQLTELRNDRAVQYEREVDRCDAAARRVKAEAAMLARRPVDPGWLRRLIGGRRADRFDERGALGYAGPLDETIAYPAADRFRRRSADAVGRAGMPGQQPPDVHDAPADETGRADDGRLHRGGSHRADGTGPGKGGVYRSAGAEPGNGRVYRSGSTPVDGPEADQDRGSWAGTNPNEGPGYDGDTVRWTATASVADPRADSVEAGSGRVEGTDRPGAGNPDQPDGRRQLTDATE